MKKVLKFLLNLVVYVAIVAGIVYGVPYYLAKKLGTNYPIAAITSGSMWPVLHIGDLVLIKATSREEIKVGDIVVWRNAKGFTIHRVTKLNATTLVTKGDGNFTADEPVKYADVVGRTVYWKDSIPLRIPYMGYVSVWSAGLRIN